MANKSTNRTINVYVNDKDVGKSLKQISKDAKKLDNLIKSGRLNQEEYNASVKRLGELKATLKRHRENVKQASSAWDEVKKSNKGALSEFLNFKNLTVLGLTTTLINAAVEFGKEIFNIAKEFISLRGEIQTLTGTTGEALDSLTARSTALSRTFGDDSNTIAQAANSLAQEMGISVTEALDLIEKGYLAGANAQGDFLDQLREYAPVAREAKISAEDFTAQIVNASRSGEFSDYGQAAIEEALLRLREMPKATEDALSAIGLSSKEINRQIKQEGVGAAIKTVSEQLNGFRDDAPEVGQALAGIFGGSGEKAGVQYIKSLKDIGGNLTDMIDTTNDLTAQQIKQVQAEKELAEVQNEISKEMADVIGGTSTLGTQIKTYLLKAVIELIQFGRGLVQMFRNLYDNNILVQKGVDLVRRAWQSQVQLFKSIPNIITGVSFAVQQMAQNIGNFFKNMYSEAVIAVNRVKSLYNDEANEIIAAEQAKIKARNSGKSIAEAFNEGFNKNFSIKAADVPEANVPTVPDGTGGGSSDTGNFGVPQSAVDENQKRLDELSDQLAKFREENRLAQLDANTKELETIRKKYDDRIQAAKDLGANDIALELEQLRNQELEAAHQRHIEVIRQQEEEALNDQLERIDEEANAEIDAEIQKQERKAQLEQEWQERKQEIQLQVDEQLMTNLQKELAAIDAHYDNLIAEAEQYGIDLAQIKELHAQKELKRQEAQNKAQDEADKIQTEKFKKRLDERAQSFQALGSIFGSVAQLMVDKEGNALEAQRVFALAEIAMNAATGIAQAISAGAGVPFPGNLAAIAMGVGAVTTGIANARAVFAQKKEGGYQNVIGPDDGKSYNAQYLGRPTGGMLASGPKLILANEAGAEYFVPNDLLRNEEVANHVAMIEAIRVGKQREKGGFTEPTARPSDASPSPTPSSVDVNMLITTVERLNTLIENGLYVVLENETLREIKLRTLELEEIIDES